MDANETLQAVAREVAGCTRCALHSSRKLSVPGEGPAGAEILLIGEGPGFYENEQGRPFVGAAGNFLNELLQKGGLKRSEVFITNVVKCRPPGNRDPNPDELLACGDYLERQIEAMDPRIIITLGRFSMARFLPNAKISAVHGQPRWIRGRLIIPMFHPAAALHQPSLKSEVERDFARLPEFLEQARKKAAAQGAEPLPGPTAQMEQPGLLDAPQPAQLDLPDAPPAPQSEEDRQTPGEGPVQLSLF